MKKISILFFKVFAKKRVKYPELPCNTITYRAILRKEWVKKDGSIRWQAFKPMAKDSDGVSTFLTTEACVENLLEPYFGTMSVHIGRVRDSSDEGVTLNVIQDNIYHAPIIGLPYVYSIVRERKYNEAIELMKHLTGRIARMAAKKMPDA